MFTGLIETTGTLLASERTGAATRLTIAAPALAGRWSTGDSIAVNGVCLTALQVEGAEEAHPGRFAADLAAETIERTTLASLQAGALVNLELPRAAGTPLGGHIVQGHVDGTGVLLSLLPLHPGNEQTDWRLSLEIPAALARYAVSQGSITVDGISLTIARLSGTTVEVAIIPHTYRATNLHTLLAGSMVNIEVDVLARYAEQQAAGTRKNAEWLTADYLLANGY